MAEKRTVTYRIIREIGVIRVNPVSGWRKELNIVSWNGREAKYDIRDWNENRSHMSKGVQLTDEDMKNLIALYQGSKSVPEVAAVPSEKAAEAQDAVHAAGAGAENDTMPAAAGTEA
ncbi:MAG: YdbC family protein [Anaerovoracaceae bacterium]|jgi:hypothetical protein